MSDQVYPEPTVGLFIMNLEGELLLLKSHKWPGKFVVPGGHVELGEKVEQAAVREAREETGLDVHDLQFLCWQEFIYDPSFWKHRHFIFFDYLCISDSLDVLLNDEAQEFFWIDPKKAMELPIDPYTRVSILKLLELVKGKLGERKVS
jgi:nucleoside triphosphatase